MADKKVSAKAAQDFVPVREVRDGVIVLKNGGLRAALMTSSINLALKSYDEQQAVLLQFQTFLNSLDFPVQLLVHSRELDIRPYVAMLEEQATEQTNELLQIQTREYIQFIKTFTKQSNIMTKNFYIVVPYDTSILDQQKSSGVLSGLFSSIGNKKKENKSKEKVEAESPEEKRSALFEEARGQLEQRVAVVEQGVGRTGIRVAQLGNDELTELFYKLFNPGDLEKPIQL